MPASRAMVMSSSTDSSSRAPSLRMWEMYMPSYSAATSESAISSSVSAKKPGV